MATNEEAGTMLVSGNSEAFTSICAAVAVRTPGLSLGEVEREAKRLACDLGVVYVAECVLAGAMTQDALAGKVARVHDALDLALVADAIGRTGGEVPDTETGADMAAAMLTRFPGVREAAYGYVAGRIGRRALDDAVLGALAVF